MGKKWRNALKRSKVNWLTVEHKIQIALLYRLCWDLNVAYRKRIYNIDHVVPLNSPVVCGLHVPWNLRIVRIKDNSRKGNKLD